ncbi:MAG: hypothetical protein JGK17_16605 [Microcoleus sp. PH2017_10_PVI_O_A]|nr:hypothetical protein [Microcoleus sp. PH2017_22_RUC_O_B]MCC3407181.1 hypothetical protein [Microcoleus sp. PH2017_10_PVI_O_A]MCC3461221.1 hypothetical protein [Microcoleus sp. PH2017_11_PCY_U_A]MCC3479712.1 hypothetical protein [Microcoleus sp. PH2017_12_PCY_D_A]MCC3529684.1 hypothetical protein [Microcoleus sp. PH2017_21_RUC_O_A]MCC3560630.1 hypothetical protein [Microcoleus sp. PH2017_27_LUM_O_A]TAE81476.1 MAG: hypothetical protein EAZ83_15170 [Oscillatoriales cyanobacterium]
MTEEQNQQPQVSLENFSAQSQSEKAAETADEFSAKVKSETVSQIIENSTQEYFKALENFLMVSINWKLSELYKRK